MKFGALKKCINVILSFKPNTIDSVEKTRKYYENKWNRYFCSENGIGKSFVLDKGNWISDSNGLFGLGEGFSNRGEIKCSDSNRRYIINLNGNHIEHCRSDVLHNGRIINVLHGSKCEIRNGILKSKNVLEKGAAIFVDMHSFLYCDMCEFKDSHTSCSGGVIYGCGFSNIKLVQCKFINNSANGFGGAIFVGENAVFESTNSEFIANKSKFAEGGAVYFKNTSQNLLFKYCKFVNNKSRDYGESIIGDKKALMLLDCEFSQNDCGEKGDPVVCDHDLANIDAYDSNIVDSRLLSKKATYNHLKL